MRSRCIRPRGLQSAKPIRRILNCVYGKLYLHVSWCRLFYYALGVDRVQKHYRYYIPSKRTLCVLWGRSSCPPINSLQLPLQEKQPLLPHGIKLDASLEEQAKALSAQLLEKHGKSGGDLVQAQNKVGYYFFTSSLNSQYVAYINLYLLQRNSHK